MAAAVERTANDVKQVANAVGDAVQDVAKFAEKEIITPVIKAVENTAKAIEKDPIGTIAQIATAVVAPQFLPLVSGANTLAHGGSVEDALKSAAITYVGGKVATAGANIGADVAKALDVGATAAKVATNVGAAVGSTVVAGGDVGKAVTGAIVGTGVGELTNTYLPPDTSAATKRAVSSAVVAELQGRDPVEAMTNSYVGSGVKYAVDTGVDYVADAYKNLKNPPNNETSAYYTPTEKTNNETSAYYTPSVPMEASNSGALPTSKGIELASSDSNFSPEINAGEIRGTPIFADDPRSKNVEPPPGYRLVHSSEGTPSYSPEYDGNVDPVKGTFFDEAQKAWLTRDEAQTDYLKRVNEQLASTELPAAFGNQIAEGPQNPEADTTGALSTITDNAEPVNNDTSSYYSSNNSAALPIAVDNAEPVNNDTSSYYSSNNSGALPIVADIVAPVNNDTSSYYGSNNSSGLPTITDNTESVNNDTSSYYSSNNSGGLTPTSLTPTSNDSLDSLREVVVKPGPDEDEPVNNDDLDSLSEVVVKPGPDEDEPLVEPIQPIQPVQPVVPMTVFPVAPTAPDPEDPGSTIPGGTRASSSNAALPVDPQSSMLSAAPLVETLSNLQQLTQLYPQLANVRPDILQMLSGSGPSKSSYYTYGGSSMPTSLMNARITSSPGPGSPLRNIGTVSTDPTGYQSFSPSGSLTQQGLDMMGYKKGGPVSQHVPEFVTGETGYYVRGKGDGQSDDIPAMLADGEYVFDADVVAALGNGSNEAGAEILDKMREAIRKHKRSAPPGKIPPKAKSPLEYLKDI